MYRWVVLILWFGLWGCSETPDDPYNAYVAGDFGTAKRLLRPLAEVGDPKALTYLGAICQIEHEYTEAARFYLEAARQNYAPGQYNLGVMLHRGNGVPPNLIEAYGWLYLALEQGHDKAQDEIYNMTGELTPNQTMKAKAWVREQVKRF